MTVAAARGLHEQLAGGRDRWRYRYSVPRELEQFTDDLGEPGDPHDKFLP
jgi:hypothetical protein